MTTRTKLVSVRVTPEVWTRVRMRCLERGESASAVVEGLLVGWLGQPSVPAIMTAVPLGVKVLTYDRDE